MKSMFLQVSNKLKKKIKIKKKWALLKIRVSGIESRQSESQERHMVTLIN